MNRLRRFTLSITNFAVLIMMPTLADEARDITLARSLVKAIEIGVESADAALDRAYAALIADTSRNPDTGIAGSTQGIRSCLAELRKKFEETCAQDRFFSADPIFYKTDKQLKSEGCFTRTEADASNCDVSYVVLGRKPLLFSAEACNFNPD